MNQESIAALREKATLMYQKARPWAAKVPLTGWVVAGFFCFAALLMAFHTALSSKDASLRLKVQHGFRSAQLQVWVDDDMAYSGKLTGSARKRLGFIPDVQGTLSETLDVSSGTHKVKVRVTSDDGDVQEDTTSGDFARDSQRTLSVNARRGDVSLNWQGSTASAPDSPPPPSSGWFARYASALILTAAGSIISALTGYAIRELPAHIRTRQDNGQIEKT